MPVVATRYRGSEDIVQSGVTGLLVSRCDPTQIAAGPEPLLTDGGLWEQMHQTGCKHMCQTFSPEVVGARIPATHRHVY